MHPLIPTAFRLIRQRLSEIAASPRAKKALAYAATLLRAYLMIVVAFSILYAFAPPLSTLMLARWAMFDKVIYKPVPLNRISPHLVRSVIRAEDSLFCSHHGVDWKSLIDTIEEGGMGGPRRGASTIPMQVAKNLFLWPQQSYLRKAVEIPLAIYLNTLWTKSRMMTVYLSIAEWGDGIYGAEAASQVYFHKSARELTRYEAALLAAALPNPKERDPNHPSEYYAGYANSLVKWANEDVNLSCVSKALKP